MTLAGGQAGRRIIRPMGSAWLRVSHACSSDASGDSDGIPNAAQRTTPPQYLSTPSLLHDNLLHSVRYSNLFLSIYGLSIFQPKSLHIV